GRSAALFRERRGAARQLRRTRASLRLSRDHQPLQSLVHHLPAHIRRARASRRHELEVVHLARMVRYLKNRGTYVLFNTNGTLLNDRNGRALIEAGLDELRVSLDASNAKSFLAVRGKDYFARILRNVRAFRNL